MTLDELRTKQQGINAAKAQALKDNLDSLTGQQLQKAECWLDEGLIILTFENGSLTVEVDDSELRVEAFKA